MRVRGLGLPTSHSTVGNLCGTFDSPKNYSQWALSFTSKGFPTVVQNYYFKLRLVESINAKPLDMESQLYWLKFAYKWTCTVQTPVVQGPTVLIRSIFKENRLQNTQFSTCYVPVVLHFSLCPGSLWLWKLWPIN